MREYYSCKKCGKRTWRNTSGLFNERREYCVECWTKVTPPDGVHHCTECGSFAQSGSNKCWRCNRLEEFEIRVKALNGQVQEERMKKTVCQDHNMKLRNQVKDLDKTVKTYQEKKQYPYELHVAQYDGVCNEGFLKSVLEGAGMAPAAIKVTYKRRL